MLFHLSGKMVTPFTPQPQRGQPFHSRSISAKIWQISHLEDAMLIRFGIRNHLSIRDYQEISLVASKLKDAESGLIEPTSNTVDKAQSTTRSPIRLLPVLALYGANASGKSTMLHGLHCFVRFISNSHKQGDADDRTPYQPFLLDDGSSSAPATYDADIIIGDTRYHYGYSIDDKRVLSEWLYAYPIVAARQTRSVLFHRNIENEDVFYFGKSLRGENRQIAKLVRPNSLFLSAAAQNSHEQLSIIYDFFRNSFARRTENSQTSLGSISSQLKKHFGDDEDQKKSALRFLTAADIGITDMNFSSVPIDEKAKAFISEFELLVKRHISSEAVEVEKENSLRVELLHAGADGKSHKIPLNLESAGTISLLKLLGPALTRLINGGVLVVDELNTTLHPLVSRELIRLFSDPESNPGQAQLLFSTHDTNILSGNLLRRDQIWFAEKDGDGASHFYSLAEIKVRSQANLEAGYLAGQFGAVPYFGLGELIQANVEQGDE
ncbi:AAA family ATPase [Dyella caseinilytica]|uniref:ATP-binding protein n=1 Tax=Dyella caseinilytica TaxID=1849581 RepID=A0ABX7GXS0_9GAMM|nr:ATP-binding protein [Dyella caseinilytica]QRN54753.1 ATP-binding protein [Dyella caseinilytica]